MYTTCLRCDGALGANTEIPHLPVGRKVAFDTVRGRLWAWPVASASSAR